MNSFFAAATESLMGKRRRTWLIVALFACTALVVYFEPTRCVRGWLWGESFFDGRPTSHWRAVLLQDLETDARIIFGTIPRPSQNRWVRSLRSVGIRPTVDTSLRLVESLDADAVLHELTKDENVRVAGFANDVLQGIRPRQPFLDDFNEPFLSLVGLISQYHREPQDFAKQMRHE